MGLHRGTVNETWLTQMRKKIIFFTGIKTFIILQGCPEIRLFSAA
jgi:hypothetical protein